ncbi:MAG: hypothetical protein PF590_03495 [Candidatus Delongbacteria bacterium]|jgi:hypothetical protein|nr:hypothetical protein [Candidatus Delongbacteria bacterium]
MLRHIIITIFALVMTVLLFSGCTKVEDNLQGTWKLETLTAEENYEVIWHFRSDQSLVRVCNQFNDTSENATQVDTAYYSIEDELTFKAIKIIESHNTACLYYVNGFFKVEKISDKLLVITRYEMIDETTGGAYLRREFTRVD